LIHFTLENIDDICPWGSDLGSNGGSDNDLSLHWFGLTSGTLYLTFGACRIYEYTNDAAAYFGEDHSKYMDYPISRFVEDFSELFRAISQSVPRQFYDLTANLPSLLSDADKWLNMNICDEDENDGFYDDLYDPLTSWVHDRALEAQHLMAGPSVYFFRCGSSLRIVWQASGKIGSGKIESGADMWTAKDGQIEMDYADFVVSVKDFGARFFKSMENQVRQAIAKDWGRVKLDKQQLSEEQQDRKKQFFNDVAHLEVSLVEKSDWQKISSVYKQMQVDLSLPANS
jgi:Family of unknown function (DUF5984)